MSPNAENSNAQASVANDVEEGLAPNEDSLQKKKSGTRLSTVSKQYDRNNKGFLDDNEKKMREMDTSNRGFLTNDKVYSMLEEQVKLQKTLVTQRKLLIGLCVFAVILALANMGTAFAAANLSKDTTTDSANNLVNKHTNEIMGTKAKGSVYEVISETGEDGRRLAPTSMVKADARSLWSDFTDGIAVKVSFTCGNGENIEPLPGGGEKTGNKYTYGSGDRAVVIDCNGNTCTVSGLSCSTYGGNTDVNDVEQTYCPISAPSSGESCDSTLIDECSYPYALCDDCNGGSFYNELLAECNSGTNTFIIAPPSCPYCGD